MAEVPKIVRERLQQQATTGVPSKPGSGWLGWTGEHPDANLLSAFVEHGLTERERAQVLDHLSRCADCRQIVALTTPELREEQLAAVPTLAARRSWWRSPLLHWAAFTAAALVVLIAVGARMRLREGRSASAPAIATLSANEAEQKSAVPAPEVSPPPAEPRPSSKKLVQAPAAQLQAPAVTAREPSGVAGGIIGGNTDKLAGVGTGSGAGIGSGSGGGIGRGPGRQSTATTAPTPAPAAPQMRMQAKAFDEGSFPSDTGVEQSQQKAPLAPTADETVAVTGVGGGPIPKSKATMLSRENAMLAKRKSPSPRWSVSDSGVLQRSFDGGRSWQDVAVGGGVTFRAVATVGSEVWAGGSGAALFHSADGGEHWSQVPMQVKGTAPSGDIVRIEFTDVQSGIVTTSAGETWTTSDAGTTWRSQ